MKLLAFGRPRGGIDARAAIASLARTELPALWALYAGGIVREMYTLNRPGAVLVLEADGPAAASTALARLPLVREGIIEFELTELRPFGAFQMLFSGAAGSGS